jgi:alkanesulfonate monooxygenase SsuD/methylene tetrahydromethanopterin reductase-like flavin-dependent oxidoreductase (luciferase family)
VPEWPEVLPDPTPEQVGAAIEMRELPYGTPDEVAASIQRYADAGIDQIVFGLLSSTMERDLATETIETFGKHVLPGFDKDPVHRTTKQREAAARES